MVKLTEQEEYNRRQKYYDMSKSYFWFMQESRKMNDAMLFFSTRVAPMLKINPYCSLSELKQIFGDEFYEAVMDLPNEAQHEIGLNKGLTKKHLDDLTQQLHKRDVQRKQLHSALLEYAQSNFEKDSLAVYIDIMQHKPLSDLEYKLNIYAPLKKKGFCIAQLGCLETENVTREDYREYGEEYPSEPSKEDWRSKSKKETIETATKALKKIKSTDWKWKNCKYKSFVRNRGTYQEDDKIAREIENNFQNYTSFNGDYWINTAHGHSYFLRVIEFDLGKIRIATANPEGEINTIKEYIKSFVPEKERASQN